MAPMGDRFDPARSSSTRPNQNTYHQQSYSGDSLHSRSSAPINSSPNDASRQPYHAAHSSYPESASAENRTAAATLSNFSSQAYNTHASAASRSSGDSGNASWNWSSHNYAPNDNMNGWTPGNTFTPAGTNSGSHGDVQTSTPYEWSGQASSHAPNSHQVMSTARWSQRHEPAKVQAVQTPSGSESHGTQAATQNSARINQPFHYTQMNASVPRNSQGQQPWSEPHMPAISQSQPTSQTPTSSVPTANEYRGSMLGARPTTVNPTMIHNRYSGQRTPMLTAAGQQQQSNTNHTRHKSNESYMSTEQGRSQPTKTGAGSTAAARQGYQMNETRRVSPQEPRQPSARSTSAPKAGSSGQNPVNVEEEEMRALFLKMREFNARNPSMLAKLWEEERQAHQASQATPTDPKSLSKEAATVKPTTHVAPRDPSNPLTSTAKDGPRADHAKVHAPDNQSRTGNTVQPKPQVQAQADPTQKSQSTAQKRQIISRAAAAWLQALPQNARLPISSATIERLLATNPNYVQLCETLERDGVRFDRPAFARHLLNINNTEADKIPALKVIHTQAAPAHSEIQQNTKNTGSKRATVPPTPIKHNVGLLGEQTKDQSAPTINPIPAAIAPPSVRGLPMSVPVAAHSVPVEQHREERRAPTNKEEAARKRTFHDLVDLTMDMDSDDEPPLKQAHLDLPPSIQSHGLSTPPHVPEPLRRPESGIGVVSQISPLSRPHLPGNVVRNLVQPTSKPPTPPVSRTKNSRLERLQVERIRGQMLVEPIMRDRVARKSKYDPLTIARDVLLATGRHPDMRPLNSHLFVMEKLLGSHGGTHASEGSHGNHSDLATIRWNILDPEPIMPKIANSAPVMTLESTEFHDADDESDGEPAQLYHAPIEAQAGGPAVMVAVPPRPLVRSRKQKVRRRRNEHPNGNPQGVFPRTAVVVTPLDAPNPEPRGYASFRQTDESGNVIKKKGRPVGWRKAIHGKDAGKAPLDGASSERRHASFVPKAERFREPHYQVFKCKWEGCTAELHNLETLKKHVVKLHGIPSADQQWVCRWRGCNSGRVKGEPGPSHEKPASFASKEKWTTHMNGRHFSSIAWKLGDGPRGGFSDHHETESEAYLSDARGRSVTPVIKPPAEQTQSSSTHLASSKEKQRATKALDEFRKHKQTIGITIDKTGSTLPNTKRRLGFMDDEDFEDVTDDEDEPGEE